MISRERWGKLRRGDVVIFGRRSTPRLVQYGPGDYVDQKHPVIHLIKMHGSWTDPDPERPVEFVYHYGNMLTLYGLDGRYLFYLPRKTWTLGMKRELLAAEYERLREKGYSPLREMKRVINQLKHGPTNSPLRCHRWPTTLRQVR